MQILVLPSVFWICKNTSQSDVLPTQNSFKSAARSSVACKELCVSQGWIRKPVIAHNHINREDRMSGSHSASLRATIPVTCETSQILWMMEWFNITGSSVCGRAAQDINTGSNIVQCQFNCLAGYTVMWKDGSPLGPRTHSLQTAFLLGRTLFSRGQW